MKATAARKLEIQITFSHRYKPAGEESSHDVFKCVMTGGLYGRHQIIGSMERCIAHAEGYWAANGQTEAAAHKAIFSQEGWEPKRKARNVVCPRGAYFRVRIEAADLTRGVVLWLAVTRSTGYERIIRTDIEGGSERAWSLDAFKRSAPKRDRELFEACKAS